MKNWKKSVLVLVVPAVLLGLAGCNMIYSICNPLIGTWEYAPSSSYKVDYTFNWDNTLGISVTNGSTTDTASGTFTQDSAAGTLSLSYTLGSTPYSMSGTYSVSGNTLTLTDSGSSTSFTRR
jgi:hypothetical protein